MEFNKSLFFEATGYRPHAGQERLHQNSARFRILACGARWGKTTCAAYEVCAAMLDKPGVYWCVGPIYSITEVLFRKILNIWLVTRPDFVDKYSESNRYLRLINGSELFGKTADNPASLLAVGVNGMVLDEPALMKEEVWHEYLQSRLTDTKGWALFTGTPKGKGWYWHLYMRGKQPTQDTYFSMEGPVWDNPMVDKNWQLAQRSNFSDRSWNQEVLGMFVDDQGTVFKNIRKYVSGNLSDPEPEKTYSIGVDLAKHMDWAVITIMDMGGRVCGWERLPHEMSWPSIRARIKSVSERYNHATCYVDSSGVGDPTLDDLHREGVPAYGVPTAQEKTQLIDSLAIALENGKISYPDIPILLNELEIFEVEMTGTGRPSYNAPAGFHDDAVISLALAWRGVKVGSQVPRFATRALY